MSARAPTARLPRVLAGLQWAIVLAGLVFLLVVAPIAFPGLLVIGDIPVVASFCVFVLAFSTVGALVAARHPRNPIGWLLCAAAIAYTIGGVGEAYAEYAFGESSALLPGASVAAWLSTWVWGAGAGMPLLVLVLFPSGAPPSRRWRPVVWLTGSGIVLLVAGIALTPGPIADYPINNPFGLPGAGTLPGRVSSAGGLALLGGGVASIVSIVVRFRNARGDERQQLKWLSYAVILIGLCVLVSLPLEAAATASTSEDLTNLSNFLITSALATIPIGIGIAVFKYRLYDIDRIISRTVTYGLLTIFLGAIYFGAVLLLQTVLGNRIADQPLAVAGTTLAVAALFRPARARIQGVIDRRFNRARFDAQQTVDAFSSHLRDEVDIDSLTAELLVVVRQTMQPGHASLWMRAPEERR